MKVTPSIILFYISAATLAAVIVSASDACTPSFRFVDPSVTPPVTVDIEYTEYFEIDLAVFPSRNLTVEAIYECEIQPKCVAFDFDGVPTRKEKSPPFFLFGNTPGPIRRGVPPIYSKDIPVGDHYITACAFSNSNCKTGRIGCEGAYVRVSDSCVNQVYGFEIVDPGPTFETIVDFNPFVISYSQFQEYGMLNINTVADTNKCGKPPIGCIKTTFGSVTRKETLFPYKLYKRTGTPALGVSKLSACTYTDIHCKYGKQGCLEFEVEVVE